MAYEKISMGSFRLIGVDWRTTNSDGFSGFRFRHLISLSNLLRSGRYLPA